ncbi:MAG: hypothetical protein R3A10_14670 [Caldilineaceae bacterium]
MEDLGVMDREDLLSLRSTLVKDINSLPVFDELFPALLRQRRRFRHAERHGGHVARVKRRCWPRRCACSTRSCANSWRSCCAVSS